MRLSQRQLRRLIEAEVDRMREPKGPNSRDDDSLDESSGGSQWNSPPKHHLLIDYENLDIHGELVAAAELIEQAIDRLRRAREADWVQARTVPNAKSMSPSAKGNVDAYLKYLTYNQVVENLKSNK